MTRGKIIFIDSKGVYTSTEFNGDMYPDGNACEVIEKFSAGCFTNIMDCIRFVEAFNRHHYGYDGELIQFTTYKDNVFSIKENWTDYLYIINRSDADWTLVDKQEDFTTLPQNSLGIAYYQTVEQIICTPCKDISVEQNRLLSAEEFVSIIERLRAASDLVDQVDELFRTSRDIIGNDFCNGAALQITHEQIVVQLLMKLMNDSREWIEFFIYELDYGRNFKPGMVTDADGMSLDLSSAVNLYHYLVAQSHR